MFCYGLFKMNREKLLLINGVFYNLEYFRDADVDEDYINNLIRDNKWDELDAYIVLLKLCDEIIAYYPANFIGSVCD